MLDLRQVLTGAWIRAVAEIQDAGEIILSHIGKSDGSDPNTIDDDKTDIYTGTIDTLSTTAQEIVGKLFFPLNILFRLPIKGENSVTLRPKDAHGPGASLILWGDGGNSKQVPSWLDKDNTGVYLPEGFHIESTKDQVKIVSNSGGTSASITLNKDGSIDVQAASGKDLTFNGGGAKVARVGDSTAGHLHPAGTLIAGPYAVSGSTATATDSINQGANNVKA